MIHRPFRRARGRALVLAVALAATCAAHADPRICTSADTLVFGNRALGSVTTLSATVSNCGDAAWSFTSVAPHPATGPDFHIATSCVTGATLAPGAACTIDVTFAPATVGQTSGALWLHNSTTTPDQLVTFYARGVDAQAGSGALAFVPAPVDFGSIALGASAGPRVLALRNAGPVPVTPSALVINGPAAYDFDALASGDAQDCAVGTPIPVGGECHLNLYFQPGAAGPRNANVVVDAPQLAGLAIGTIEGMGTAQPAAPTVAVIEFHHAQSGQYFLSADPAEIAFIDGGGLGDGWSRTGMRFSAWPREATLPTDSLPVCRFFGTPGVGPNSHFFTADASECAKVRTDPHWIDEGIAFRARLPQGGTCPAGNDAVLRLWRAGADPTASRHRYVTDAGVVPAMLADGWVLEGPVFCAPR